MKKIDPEDNIKELKRSLKVSLSCLKNIIHDEDYLQENRYWAKDIRSDLRLIIKEVRKKTLRHFSYESMIRFRNKYDDRYLQKYKKIK